MSFTDPLPACIELYADQLMVSSTTRVPCFCVCLPRLVIDISTSHKGWMSELHICMNTFDWGLDRAQNLALLPWLGCTRLRYPVIGQYQIDGAILRTSFIVKLSFRLRPFDTRTLTTIPAYFVIQIHLGFKSCRNALAINQLTDRNSDEEVHSNL